MTAQTPTVLKTYFNTGDKPTEAQFGDLIDTITQAGTTATLGTSSSSTQPQKSGDATTGLYSDAVNTLSAAVGGVEQIRITSTGVALTNALAVGQGGTGATTATTARSNLSAAKSGANTDITSLNFGDSTLSNYKEGTWTPTWTNLTVVGSLTTNVGRYTRIGNIVYYSITLIGSTSIAITGGSTHGTLPVSPTASDVCFSTNVSTGIGYGNGTITIATNEIYPASVSATGGIVVISGKYQVN